MFLSRLALCINSRVFSSFPLRKTEYSYPFNLILITFRDKRRSVTRNTKIGPRAGAYHRLMGISKRNINSRTKWKVKEKHNCYGCRSDGSETPFNLCFNELLLFPPWRHSENRFSGSRIWFYGPNWSLERRVVGDHVLIDDFVFLGDRRWVMWVGAAIWWNFE